MASQERTRSCLLEAAWENVAVLAVGLILDIAKWHRVAKCWYYTEDFITYTVTLDYQWQRYQNVKVLFLSLIWYICQIGQGSYGRK